MSITVYSVGHSNQSADQLIALLQKHGIALLADVRSRPASRFSPQFNRETLRKSLEAAGIGYRWLGQALGGKPRAPEPVFSEGIGDLLDLAGEQRVAMMCAERDPLDCHRTHLVTPALLQRGASVAHILGDGTLLPHDALQQPRKEDPKQGSLF